MTFYHDIVSAAWWIRMSIGASTRERKNGAKSTHAFLSQMCAGSMRIRDSV